MAKTDGTDLLEKINKNEVAKKEKPKTLVEFIEAMKPQIQRALPKHMDADRITRIAITTLKTTPKLASCDPMSFIGALMQSAQLGLEPNTPLGEAYLIPYFSNRRQSLEAKFQIGYKGILELSMRSNQYKAIYAHEVYASDAFSYEYGLNKDLIHKPADEPKGDPIYYYAVYHLKNGGYDFVVWSRAKVEKHRKRFSKAEKESPWKTDFDSMAKKTVLINLLKYAPKSIELARQLSTDETIKKDICRDMTEVPSQEIDFIDIEPDVDEDSTNDDSKPSGSQETATEPQLKKLFAMSKERNISDEVMHSLIEERYKKKSRKDLTKKEIQDLFEFLETGEAKETEEDFDKGFEEYEKSQKK